MQQRAGSDQRAGELLWRREMRRISRFTREEIGAGLVQAGHQVQAESRSRR